MHDRISDPFAEPTMSAELGIVGPIVMSCAALIAGMSLGFVAAIGWLFF